MYKNIPASFLILTLDPGQKNAIFSNPAVSEETSACKNAHNSTHTHTA